MTASSEWGAYIPFTSDVADDTAPNNVNALRTMANNAMHLGDESAQVRINWHVQFGKNQLGLEDNVFDLVWTCAFPLTRKPDGLGYALRARMAGRSAPNPTGGGDLVQLRMAVAGSAAEADDDINRVSEPNVFVVSTSSTTEDWLGEAVLTLPDDMVRRATVPVYAPDEIGGVAFSALHTWVVVRVHGSSPDTGNSLAALTGVHLAEFIG